MSGSERAWLHGDLVMSPTLLHELHLHALSCYPSECCGFVAGPASDPLLLDKALREVNEADKYHVRDPETFPRTSRTYFKINELRAARAFEQGEGSDQPIKVIYHSHCDAGAYFSKEDAATFASDATLMWPCAFIVISVIEGRVAETKLWAHEPFTNDFRESKLTVR